MNYSFLYQQIVNTYSSIPMRFFRGYTLPPLQVFLEVTYNCNLSCDFCQFLRTENHDASSAVAQRRTELSIGELKRVAAEIPRTAIVSFTGGEPFVKAGFMDLLAFSSERNKTHIFTNATKIDMQTADSLVSLGAGNVFSPGLVLVGISLEGTEATHNRIARRPWAYDKTVAGVEALCRCRAARNRNYPLLELKTVISENNVGELYDIYSLAKRCRVDIFNVMTMNMLPQAGRTGRGVEASYLQPPPAVAPVDPEVLREQLAKISEDACRSNIQIRTTPQGFDFAAIIDYYSGSRRLREYRCCYPWYGAGISAYGDVRICPYAATGNVRENSFAELLNNAPAKAFRKDLRRSRIFPGCWGCCMLVPRHRRTNC